MTKWNHWFRDDEAEQSSFRLIIEVAVIIAVLAAVFVGVKAVDAWRSSDCASSPCVQ